MPARSSSKIAHFSRCQLGTAAAAGVRSVTAAAAVTARGSGRPAKMPPPGTTTQVPFCTSIESALPMVRRLKPLARQIARVAARRRLPLLTACAARLPRYATHSWSLRYDAIAPHEKESSGLLHDNI